MPDPNDAHQVSAAIAILGNNHHHLIDAHEKCLDLLELIDGRKLTESNVATVAAALRQLTSGSLAAIQNSMIVFRRQIVIEIERLADDE